MSKYKQKKPFEKISNKSNKYIFKCFDIATMNLLKKKSFKVLLIVQFLKKLYLKKDIKVLLNFFQKKQEVKRLMK